MLNNFDPYSSQNPVRSYWTILKLHMFDGESRWSPFRPQEKTRQKLHGPTPWDVSLWRRCFKKPLSCMRCNWPWKRDTRSAGSENGIYRNIPYKFHTCHIVYPHVPPFIGHWDKNDGYVDYNQWSWDATIFRRNQLSSNGGSYTSVSSNVAGKSKNKLL